MGMQPLKMVPAANSSLMWMALLSRDTAANRTMSASGDGLGERGAHPDPQICKCVTSELIHRTALLDCMETRNSHLAAVKICTQMPPDLMSDRTDPPILFFQNIASRCVLDRRVGSTADSRRRHSLSGTGLKPFGPLAPPAALVLFRASQPCRR